MSIVKNATIVGGSVLVAGVGASMLIPVAMTTFGTVVSGVAATLQSTAAACTLSNSILLGTASIPLTYLRSKL
jgi:3-polyprenyl-4-hydroxybenzoate decarboxylase